MSGKTWGEYEGKYYALLKYEESSLNALFTTWPERLKSRKKSPIFLYMSLFRCTVNHEIRIGKGSPPGYRTFPTRTLS